MVNTTGYLHAVMPSLARLKLPIETLFSLCSTHLLAGSSTQIKEESIGNDLTLPEAPEGTIGGAGTADTDL